MPAPDSPGRLPSVPVPGRGTHHTPATTLAALAAAVALAGCGTSDGAGPPSAAPTGSPTTAYPITITRVGGLAGFDDHLVVTADGTVTGTTRAGSVSCRLDDALVTGLATHLGTVPTAGTGPTTGTDSIVVTVSAGGATVDLGGAGTDPLSLAVSALLADLTLPADQRSRCR